MIDSFPTTVAVRDAWSFMKGKDLDGWRDSLRYRSTTMKDAFECPGHVEFYKDHNFGAVIGYGDYTGLSVVLPETIQKLSQVVFSNQ